LNSDDISEIFKAHQHAQENNAFDFQPYVDAIINAPQEQLDDVMALINAKTEKETKDAIERTGVASQQTDECRALPFDQLTLVQKLNRFREKLVEHMQHEIIFNPNHILAGLKHNEQIWDEVRVGRITDANYRMLSVIFSQLMGQRNAPECVLQDIRQGTLCLTEKNESRTRQSCFSALKPIYNVVMVNVLLGDSLAIDGIGYKFGAGADGLRRRLAWGPCDRRTFSKLMSSKNIKLGELMQHSTAHSPSSLHVVQ
jgi:hypothetical protein